MRPHVGLSAFAEMIMTWVCLTKGVTGNLEVELLNTDYYVQQRSSTFFFEKAEAAGLEPADPPRVFRYSKPGLHPARSLP